MKQIIIRLDDACERMNLEKWRKMEILLEKYRIKPLVAVIPHCEDKMMEEYEYNPNFWKLVETWIDKGWEIALHGYNHVYSSSSGGINPVNKRSEFAGLSVVEQKEKIEKGISIFNEHGIMPRVFVAPSHTFDENTLLVLQEYTDIRIISDTIAWSEYSKGVFTFIPQQSGSVRNLPFHTITFCYHPNTMSENDFVKLEQFLSKNKFTYYDYGQIKRKRTIFEIILQKIYYLRHI